LCHTEAPEKGEQQAVRDKNPDKSDAPPGKRGRLGWDSGRRGRQWHGKALALSHRAISTVIRGAMALHPVNITFSDIEKIPAWGQLCKTILADEHKI
jgi:hypothetical protein